MSRRRSKIKTPLAILTADWHIRESIPVCRTDNFYRTQKRKLEWIAELSQEYEIPVILAGDLFHKWKTSPQLEAMTIETTNNFHINDFFSLFCVPGNHDLPKHSLKEISKSSYFVLQKSSVLNDCTLKDTIYSKKSNIDYIYVHPFPFGTEIQNVEKEDDTLNICVAHQLTYDSKKPWANCKADSAKKLLKKYDGYDLIVTGDNHQSFVTEYKGRLLVNPGCITRQTGAFVDFKPSVYVWYSDNTVERKYIPIEKDVINRDHLKKVEERNEKLDAFIIELEKRQKQNEDYEYLMDFVENLKIYTNGDKEFTKKVIAKLWDHVEI